MKIMLFILVALFLIAFLSPYLVHLARTIFIMLIGVVIGYSLARVKND